MIDVSPKDFDKTTIRTKAQVPNRILGTTTRKVVQKMIWIALKLRNRNYYPSPSSRKAVETCLKLSMSTL